MIDYNRDHRLTDTDTKPTNLRNDSRHEKDDVVIRDTTQSGKVPDPVAPA